MTIIPTPLGDTVDEAETNALLSYRDSSVEARGLQPCAVRRKPAAQTPAAPPVFALPPDKTDPASYQGNALAARVAAANRANYCVKEYAAYVIEKLRPFLNQKVLKNTSWGTSLTKKVSEALGEVVSPLDSGERFSISTQGHWISVRCNVYRHATDGRYSNGSGWEAYAAVGKTGGTDTLQALEDKLPELRTDYTEAEIRGKRQVVAGLKEQLRAAESNLAGWGEYDR